MGPIVVQIWVQLSQQNGKVSMVIKINSSCSYVDVTQFIKYNINTHKTH